MALPRAVQRTAYTTLLSSPAGLSRTTLFLKLSGLKDQVCKIIVVVVVVVTIILKVYCRSILW